VFNRTIVQLIPSMRAKSGGPVNVVRSIKHVMDRININNEVIETQERWFSSGTKFFSNISNIYFSHCIWDIKSFTYIILGNNSYIFSHGMLSRKAFGRNKYKKRIFSKLFYLLVQIRRVTVIFGSQSEFDEAIFQPKNHLILPNPVKPIVDSSHSAIMKNRTGKIKFVYFSRFDKRKGLSELISAFDAVSPDNAEFHILGLISDTDYENSIKNLTKNKPNVVIHENCTGVEARKIMQKCDIICLWSQFEGQPMSVLEGVSDGLLPLVSPNCNLPFETMSYFGLQTFTSVTDLPKIIEYFCAFDRNSLEKLRKDYQSTIDLNELLNQRFERFLRNL